MKLLSIINMLTAHDFDFKGKKQFSLKPTFCIFERRNLEKHFTRICRYLILWYRVLARFWVFPKVLWPAPWVRHRCLWWKENKWYKKYCSEFRETSNRSGINYSPIFSLLPTFRNFSYILPTFWYLRFLSFRLSYISIFLISCTDIRILVTLIYPPL